jgi:hypothetical protein
MCGEVVIYLRHTYGICLEGLKNTIQSSIKILHLSRHLKHGPPETEAGMLATE